MESSYPAQLLLLASKLICTIVFGVLPCDQDCPFGTPTQVQRVPSCFGGVSGPQRYSKHVSGTGGCQHAHAPDNLYAD